MVVNVVRNLNARVDFVKMDYVQQPKVLVCIVILQTNVQAINVLTMRVHAHQIKDVFVTLTRNAAQEIAMLVFVNLVHQLQ